MRIVSRAHGIAVVIAILWSVFVVASIVVGIILWPRFGSYSYSSQGVKLVYPARWKVTHTNYYQGDGKKHSGIVLKGPKSGAPVTFSEVYGAPSNTLKSSSQESALLVSAQPASKFANTMDVQLIAESKSQSSDVFTSMEFLLSTDNYNSRHLVAGKMVPQSAQPPEFVVAKQRLLLMSNSQKVYSDVASARAWFATDEAKTAHRIISGAKLSDK